MIKVENVTKKYGTHVAVDDINFEIKDGEIVGFLGPNGAGKTTTMNMITGFIEANSGKIEVEGYDISKKAGKAKKEIGYMPETTPLYNELTPKEFVSYMAELKGVARKTRKEEVQRVLKQVNIEDVQDKIIRNLSRGYRQRVSLAGALVGNPKVLILDEPTVGLDPKQVIQIRNLIKSLGKDHTVILSSHILSEISQICEKVIIINKGKLVAIDTPENLENKVQTGNLLLVTVEDPEKKIEKVVKTIKSVKGIEKVKELPDGTKQYSIMAEGTNDIRKEIFEVFAKNRNYHLRTKKIRSNLRRSLYQTNWQAKNNQGKWKKGTETRTHTQRKNSKKRK